MTRRIRGESSHAIAGAFVFLLLGVFAVFSTLLVLIGAQAYRATTDSSAAHNTQRILHAYVLGSVRGDDAVDTLNVETEQGLEMITVSYDYGGEIYKKRIYCYDGALREHFAAVEYGFDPAAGEVVCEAQSFHVQTDGDLMTVIMDDEEGRTYTAQIALRAAR